MSRRSSFSRLRINRFTRREDGGFVIFALFLMVVMLLVTGLAVDIARFEVDRKNAQGALDNAILSATNLRQELDSEEVVYSFMEKAGFDRSDVNVDFDQITTSDGAEVVSRSIDANVQVRTPTIFMDNVGVDELSTRPASGAIETVQNVEISLVLDISGSMRFGPSEYNRIAGLRDAVDEFVNIVLDVQCDANGANCVQSPDSQRTTINVIPYAGNVNPGSALFASMGGSRWHNWSSCAEVSDADFDHSDLPNDDLRQLPHFMRWAIEPNTMAWGWCPKENASILVAQNNAEKIKQYVRNIRLHDGTATHVGMKYGVALLNPSSRAAFTDLNALDVDDPKRVEDLYRFRPANFTDNVQKYVIVMTDGGTTHSYRPAEVDYDDVYSLTPDEWVGFFAAEPRVAPATPSADWERIFGRYGSHSIQEDAENPEAVEVDIGGDGEVDGRYVVVENASETVETGYPSGTIFVDQDGVRHTAGVNNQNLLATCDFAKTPVTLSDGTTKGDRITVFSIAFNAGRGPAQLMANCASEPRVPFFWEISGAPNNGALRDAFSAIAYSINKLRLTQ